MATSTATPSYPYSLASKKRNVPARVLTGGGGYAFYPNTASASLQTAPTVTGTKYAVPPTYPYTVGLSKIETTAFAGAQVPDTLQVATTTDTSNLSTASIDEVTTITVDETLNGTSTIWYAWSFDGRLTWWVYLSATWTQIVKEDGGVWKYLSAPATWSAASIDDMYQALREAFGVAANRMTGTQVNAMVTADWQDTDGVVPGITQAVDVAVGITEGSSQERSYLSSVTLKYSDAGTTTVDGWIGGDWVDLGWTDGTEVGGIPWAQSGIITGTEKTLDYSVQSGVPGYFLRVRTNGTGPNTTLSRILYKAPCQPLANIGDGQPNTVNGFIYEDTSANSILDYTSEVSDNTLTNFSVATIPMATTDYLYIGFYDQFDAIEMTPYLENNQNSSFLTVAYWNGARWVNLTIEDGTTGETTITLSRKGKISWTLPSDWKENIPFDAFLSRAYWVRLSVSAVLTATTAIAECRVYSVPTALKKHKFAAVAGDKLYLANRPDNANQVDISRPLEEYGFNGDTYWTGNVGGQDAILALSAAYDTLFVWKPETVHQWNGDGFSGAEAARHTPINSQVVVKATVQNKTALFFLNQNGGFGIAGLHTDSTWNTAAITELSGVLDFWDANVAPRLDMSYLHNACGEYWPKKNWLVWSVPLILSGSSQTTNNVLLILDLNLMAWFQFRYPFGISAMCTAYTANSSAPQQLGDLIFLAGDYEGRIIRLFDPSATTDLGTAISCYAETGWQHHGDPTLEKDLRGVWIYGEITSGNVTLTTTGRYNYAQALLQPTSSTRVFADLAGVTGQLGLAKEFSGTDRGNYFKYRLSWSGPANLYGVALEIEPERSQ